MLNSHNFAQRTENKPILKPIDSSDDLSKYRVACRVDSVYYNIKGKESHANVLLDVSFDLADVELSTWTISCKLLI
jgi:hypothetical protein